MRAVLLRHTLPDGSWHIDWILELTSDQAARLPAFRLAGRPDTGLPDGFEGERMPDHRRAYLDYEGPVSGDRGAVLRVASGRVLLARGWPDRIDVAAEFEGSAWRWIGTPVSGSTWRFERSVFTGTDEMCR